MKAQIGDCPLAASKLGGGTAPLGNMYKKITDAEAADALEALWEGGVRIFDTAPFYGYGLAERRLGDFLRSKPRDEYLLSTKVGRMLEPRLGKEPSDTFFLSDLPFNPVFDYSYDAAMRSFEDSLQRIGQDRIDIMLIHDTGVAEHGERQPEMFKTAIDGAAIALAKLREQKMISAIGMGLNEWEVAEAGLRAFDFDVFLLAGRYTLLEHKAADSFLPLCEQRGARVMVGGAFNSGLLAAADPAKSTYNYAPAPAELIERTVRLREVCSRHQVELPAAALQFAGAHPVVSTVLAGIQSRNHAQAATAWIDVQLPDALWDELEDEGLIPADSPRPG